ncbi:radical SAM protein [archaeon]|nr:radical SAM protein [archaeon]
MVAQLDPGISIGTTTKVDTTFDDLFSTFYRLAAQDSLIRAMGPLRETDAFGEYQARVSDVQDRDSYDSFMGSLPSNADIRAVVKAEIVEAYGSFDGQIGEIEQQRTAALENPEVYYPEFTSAVIERVNERLGTDLERVPASKDDYPTFIGLLEDGVNLSLEEKLTPVNGVRYADVVEVTNMNGFDTSNLEDEYHYGGNEDDLALGSRGEVINIVSGVRYTIVVDGKEWQIHPDEIQVTGENRLVALVGEGNYGAAVTAFVDGIVEELTPEFIERARAKIGQGFDAKVVAVTKELKIKYGLVAEQVRAIHAGEDFVYEVEGGRDEGLTLPFQRLASLALKALGYKVDKPTVTIQIGSIKNEEGFIDFVLNSAKELRNKDYAGLAGEQMDVLSLLLNNEYDAVSRRSLQTGGERQGHILEDTIDAWIKTRTTGGQLGTAFSLNRALLYHDQDIFSSVPFSPPSEELHRVIKLEVGSGCSYGACTYCTEYGRVDFTIRKLDDFRAHVAAVRKKMGRDVYNIERLFLAGGNIFAMPTKKVLAYNDIARNAFRGDTDIRRISAFTRTEGLAKKSVGEINDIVGHGLNMVFWGVETGANSVLDYVNKGTTHEKMMEAASKIPNSNMQVSVMIMTGLGGLRHYEDHVVETTRLLNAMQPRFVTFMTVNPKPWSVYAKRMAEEMERGENMPLTDEMVVEQMYDIVRGLDSRAWRGHRCLVGAYRLPTEKVANNPVEFRGRLENHGGKGQILTGLQNLFRGDFQPSPLIPAGEFNRTGSRIRAMLEV